MKRMWIVILALLGVGSCVGGLVGSVLYFTLGLTECADGFFAAVKRQDLVAARVYLSEDFRAHASEAALVEFIGTGPLAHCASTHWSSREIKNDTGRLEGEVQSDSGGVTPITLTLVRERGEWRIQSLARAEAGIVQQLR